MYIAGMRAKILFQKHIVKADSIGNRLNEWENFYSCWASVKTSGRAANENENAAQTIQQSRLDFTVRYCEKVSEITSTEYRIFFNGRIYDIEAVDVMKFEKKCLKFTAVLVNR